MVILCNNFFLIVQFTSLTYIVYEKFQSYNFVVGDRYDEEPRGYRDRVANSKLDEIDDWDNGRKSVVSEAIDKAKDLWNRAQGRQYPDDTYG